MDLEHVGEVDEADAMEETQLTEKQILNIAAEFGQHTIAAQELFKMERQMSRRGVVQGWVFSLRQKSVASTPPRSSSSFKAVAR